MKIKNIVLSSLLLGSISLVGCGGGDSDINNDDINQNINNDDANENDNPNITTDNCTKVTDHIVEDSIWSASCYKVSIDLDIDAQLTIKEGTKVYFDVGRNMRIDDGKLIAIGTAEKPIIFTSEEETRGYWDGLSFYGASSNQNELTHIIVEYAKIGLEVTSVGSEVSRLSVSDSTFRENSEYGFKFNSTAILDKFENIHSYDNAISGYTYANSLYPLGEESDFSGNDKDYIEVYGDIISKKQTWNALNVPVLLTHSVEIDSDLTINAGASFLCDSGISMRIDDGTLEAIGTKTEPIIFTANQKTKGYWEGIHFYTSDNIKNILSYVHISYATTALKVSGAGTTITRLKVNDSNLSYNENYGFSFDNLSSIDDFSNMLVYENDTVGQATANNIYRLDANSLFAGNTNDYIEISSYALTKEHTWNALTVPILFTKQTDIDAFLTIKAGASFLFDVDAGLRIDDGALTAIGTEAKPITFTGKQQTTGYWDSINFYGSQDTRNKMSYVELSYGGRESYGLLMLSGSDSTLELSNATIGYSGGYGIDTVCKGVIVMDNVSYEENTLADFYRPDNCSS